MPRRSAWSDFVPPGSREPEPIHVLYGCQPYEAGRDLSMGHPDRSGLRRPSPDRRNEPCPRCGGTPENRTYCECCSRVELSIQSRIEELKMADRLKADAADRAKRQVAFAQRIAGAKEKRRAGAESA